MPTDNEFETWVRQKNLNSEENQREFQQGKYKVIEQIGKGGMGTVYLARVDPLNRDVAIKEFSPESPSSYNSEIEPRIWQDLKTAFVREATILANLRHECLPVVFDFFTENRSNYLVMEFVKGDDLQKRMQSLGEYGQFPVSWVKRWAEDLLDVLIYLHDRQPPIFHRDIKPANLKIRNDKICLLDFGLAKESIRNVSSSIDEKTLQGFTEGFAPLEQMGGEKTTAQTDIYGLSATLYYLLTGKKPKYDWTRKDNIKVPDVRSLRSDIDNSFALVIMQGLAVEPQHRPGSAREMLEGLRGGKVNEDSSNNERAVVTSFDSSLTKPSPPISQTYPMPSPTPVPYNQTPLINEHPEPSRRRGIIFALVGGAFLFIIGMIVIGVIVFQKPLREEQLVSEQKLYKSPSTEANIGTLSSDTKVQIGAEKKDPTIGTFYEIKSPKEGWILCKKGETCFNSK